MKTFLHQIEQPSQGYRFNVDSLLLARFAKFHPKDHVCDLGAGVGILGILALKWGKVKEVKAIEVQSELAKYARLNIQKLHLEDRMELIEANWNDLDHFLKPTSFDVVMSNPPYRKKGSGRTSPHLSKSIAKHELLGAMPDLLKVTSKILKKSGKFYIIYPILRIEEFILNLQQQKLKIQRLLFVHPFQKSSATHFMAEVVRSVKGEIQIEAPLILYKNHLQYHPEIENWLGIKSPL